MHTITDTVILDGVRTTQDGYLVGEVKIARTGIQVYQAGEVGRTGKPIRVYRPEAEVFDEASMASMAHRPVTVDHPSDMVDASNWKHLAVGQTGGQVKRDGDYVMVPMVVMDADAINSIRQGKRQLSVGYTANLDFTHGITDSGEEYDAIQTNIRGNHVAIVNSGKAGSQARIGDAGQWGGKPSTRGESEMADAIKTRAVLVDGLSVETTDAGAQALEKLLGDIAALNQKIADADAARQSEIEAKDAEIAKRDAEIDALKKSALTDADLDAKVQARAALVADASAVAPSVDIKGMSDSAIRKAVVVAKLGDAMAAKPDAYIDARFDILVEDAKKGGFTVDAKSDARDDIYAKRDAELQNAWMTKEAANA